MMNPMHEQPTADPSMVASLISAISTAVNQVAIPDVTTTADILSALFTTLDAALRVARQDVDPVDAEYNSNEISRVLMELLCEFGTVDTKLN